MAKSDLKRKTINGFFWGMMESILSQGQGIVYGAILARILSVQEYGLLGMITIFIGISQVFVDSGLNQALIRKQNCTEKDYSTVFWTNVMIGLLFFIIIWLCAPLIANFYKEPKLVELTRVSGIAILIGSLTLIQQTKITKEIDFRTLTFISTTGTFIAGITSIIMALTGMGVWSLVWRNIINQVVRSIMLWIYNKWLPRWEFSYRSFKELLGFGSNILFTSLLAAIFKSFYNLIIGKSYSKTMLGYYTNSEQYSTLTSNIIVNVTSKVSYPVLSKIQDDDEKLKSSCSKLVQTIMFTSFFLMFGLIAIAKPLLIIPLGTKWLPSVIFFQALCIAYAIGPMHMINQNIMKIKGRSDLFLKTEIFKYILLVPFLILGIIFGLPILIGGFIAFYWISFIINAMYSKKLIGYSALEQLKEIMPLFFLCMLPALFCFYVGTIYQNHLFILLLIQSVIYLVTVIGISEIIKLNPYIELKSILIEKVIIIYKQLKNNRTDENEPL